MHGVTYGNPTFFNFSSQLESLWALGTGSDAGMDYRATSFSSFTARLTVLVETQKCNAKAAIEYAIEL